MLITYSGQRSKDVAPEEYLKDSYGVGLMLTYSDFFKKKSSEAKRRFKKHRMNKQSSIPLILDSGATFLYNRYVKKETKGAPGTSMKDRKRVDFSFYKTKTFKDFREAYIEFVLKNSKHLYAYINMDWINNAKGSYESLKYMESRGCHPLPVFHIGNDTKWLRRYIDEGYKFICIGGITPNPTTVIMPTLDRIWRDILTNDDGMPLAKIHGLACTSYTLMKRYPWYSVDSATWTKLGAWGGIYVPRKTKGKFSFNNLNRPPFGIHVSVEAQEIRMEDSPLFPMSDEHKKYVAGELNVYKSMSVGIKSLIKEWLEFIDVPFGGVHKGKTVLGVTNDYQSRMKANLGFYQALVESIPKYPWPLPSEVKKPRRKPFFKC